MMRGSWSLSLLRLRTHEVVQDVAQVAERVGLVISFAAKLLHQVVDHASQVWLSLAWSTTQVHASEHLC